MFGKKDYIPAPTFQAKSDNNRVPAALLANLKAAMTWRTYAGAHRQNTEPISNVYTQQAKPRPAFIAYIGAGLNTLFGKREG